MITRRDFLATSFAYLLQPSHSTKPSRTRVFPPEPIRFNEITQQAGLDFVLQNNPTPRKHIIESMPGGVAAFDYNNDGRTDIFFTDGASIPSLEKDSPKYFNRLYRNDGAMKFTDVTSEADLVAQSEGTAEGRF